MGNARSADPRSTITPDSFTVARDLIGLPLAKPSRRLGAMLIDLLLVAILANAGGVFLAFAAAIALWRASSPSAKIGTVRRGARGLLRFGAALVLFIGVLNVWDRLTDRDGGGSGQAPGDAATGAALDRIDLGSIPDYVTLTTATDSAEVRGAARNLADRLAVDAASHTTRDIASELLAEVNDPGAREILRTALGSAAVPSRDTLPLGDSAVRLYAEALARGDTGEADRLREPAGEAIAGDQIRGLENQRDDLRSRNQELEREVDRDRGFIGFIRSIADDLGIGFGWGALYFTAFLTLWRGKTPGKRVFGVRVIRLDGRPLSWWIAFERFGGYAASLSIGLLGFLQILWDRNRQGLHDKAVETVVIRDLPPSLSAAPGWQLAGRSEPRAS